MGMAYFAGLSCVRIKPRLETLAPGPLAYPEVSSSNCASFVQLVVS